MKGDGTSHIKVGLSGRPSKAKTSLKVGSGGNLKAASMDVQSWIQNAIRW